MIMKKKFLKNKELNKNLKREKKRRKKKKYIKIIKKYNFYNDIYNMIN
jgi:hypothetical protein